MLRWTKFGRSVYLVGANTLSARSVGVNVKLIKFLPFLFSGVLAAFASIVFISQTATGFARYGTASYGGTGWEFRALTMCIVGGLSISGGRGTYIGLAIAFLILGSLTNGLTFINMPLNWRDFFEGAILIGAIILDSRRARRTELIV
jgi:ribose/xylose/arabinose/galactoside ABC-type transport system permease subunit